MVCCLVLIAAKCVICRWLRQYKVMHFPDLEIFILVTSSFETFYVVHDCHPNPLNVSTSKFNAFLSTQITF